MLGLTLMFSCGGASTSRLQARSAIPDTPAPGGSVTDGSAGRSAGDVQMNDGGFNGGEGGGGESLMGGPGGIYDETVDWPIVSFTDPRDGSTYDIVDGRVIVTFLNQPVYPVVDDNYFDVPRLPIDPYYTQLQQSGFATPPSGDPAVAAFVATESLVVISEWWSVSALAAILPPGQTVADAVASWPHDYPALIMSVDPDIVQRSDVLPPVGTNPDDDRFASISADPYDWQYAVRRAAAQDINIQNVWDVMVDGNHEQESSSYQGIYVAVMDTGVDYDTGISLGAPVNQDLVRNSAEYGCNVGEDKKNSTTFKLRTLEGGEPWQWQQDKSANYAKAIGHATCVAGIISADVNNDPNTTEDNRDIAGVAYNPRYFPVAMKVDVRVDSEGNPGSSHSTITVLNAYTAIGLVKGVYTKASEGFPANMYVPNYNIEVVNCSFGHLGRVGAAEQLHLDILGNKMLFVASSGNGANDGSYTNGENIYTKFPAKHAKAIGVTEHNASGQRTFGFFGSETDIAAPGVYCWTCDMQGNNSYGQPLGYSSKATTQFSGTSASSPYVAGVAAIVTGRFNLNPSLIRHLIVTNERSMDGVDTENELANVDAVDAFNAMY